MSARLIRIQLRVMVLLLIPSAARADGSAAGGSEAVDTSRLQARTVAAVRAQKRLASSNNQQQNKARSGETLYLDAQDVTFRSYDERLVAAIRARWRSLREQHRDFQRFGRVVVEFRLKSDGGISQVKIRENQVGPILALFCEQAIREATAFSEFPSDMRRMYGNYRTMKMAFYYD